MVVCCGQASGFIAAGWGGGTIHLTSGFFYKACVTRERVSGGE